MSAWPKVALSDVCELNPARDPNLKIGENDAVSFVPMTAVDDESGTIAASLSRPFSEVRKGYTYFREGDLLFAKITPCMQNGKHAVVGGTIGGFGFGSTEFHVLRPRDRILVEWIHSFLRQPQVLRNFEEQMTGSVGQQRLPEEILARVELPLPPLPEQKRVAAALRTQLATVARTRAAVAAQLKAAAKIEVALLEKFFPSQGDAQRQQPLVELLGASLRTGLSKPMLPDSAFKCLTLSAVRNGTLDFTASKPVDVTPAEAEVNRVRAGAFYVVRGNGNRELVGRGALAPNGTDIKVIFPDLLFEIVPNSGQLLPAFLRWAWDSPSVRRQIEDKAQTSAGIYKINQRNLLQIRVPVPALEEQARIVREIESRSAAARRLTAKLGDKLAALDHLPARLLARAFTDPHVQEKAHLAVVG